MVEKIFMIMGAGLGYIIGYLEEKKNYVQKDEVIKKKTRFVPLLYSIMGLIVGCYAGMFINKLI
jgi:hypothetical protein